MNRVSSVQSLSLVWISVTPRTTACQASLSITNSQSLLKLMSIMSVMPSNHLILCRPFLLPPSVFPSIRVFSSVSVLCIRWPKYRIFSMWSCYWDHEHHSSTGETLALTLTKNSQESNVCIVPFIQQSFSRTFSVFLQPHASHVSLPCPGFCTFLA